MANNTSSKKPSGPGANRAPFYAVLIAIVVLGAGALLYLKRTPGTAPQNNEAYEKLRRTYANAGPPKPYVLGNPKAPVVIEEFADFECPSCGGYATITEPDVRKRIIDPGLAYYKYYDFPLPMHKNTQAASNAAACADEQGKFWEMHDQLFAGQDQWGMIEGGGEVTDNPKSVFLNYAKAIGLNTAQWEQCFDAHKYQSRVDANAAEAVRRTVEQTPTFYVNGTKVAGRISYDEMKKLVDAATKVGTPAAADSALNNIIKH